jgi:hypothetical protein
MSTSSVDAVCDEALIRTNHRQILNLNLSDIIGAGIDFSLVMQGQEFPVHVEASEQHLPVSAKEEHVLKRAAEQCYMMAVSYGLDFSEQFHQMDYRAQIGYIEQHTIGNGSAKYLQAWVNIHSGEYAVYHRLEDQFKVLVYHTLVADYDFADSRAMQVLDDNDSRLDEVFSRMFENLIEFKSYLMRPIQADMVEKFSDHSPYNA